MHEKTHVANEIARQSVYGPTLFAGPPFHGTIIHVSEPLSAGLHRTVERTARRLRIQRAIDAACVGGVVGCALAAPALVAIVHGAWAVDPWALLVLAALPLAGAIFGATRRLDPLGVAIELDRAHELDDRFANAWEVTRIPEPDRSPFMRAHLQRSGPLFADMRPALAAPLRTPAHLDLLAVSALLALAAGITAPTPAPAPTYIAPPPIEAVRVVSAETAFERERVAALRALAEQSGDATILAWVDALDDILDQIERGEDPRAVAEQLDALEAAFAEHELPERPELAEAFLEAAEALGDEASDLARALREGALAEAAEAVERLGDAEATADLARALAAAAEALDPRSEVLARDLERAERRLEELLDRYGREQEAWSERQAQRLDEARDAVTQAAEARRLEREGFGVTERERAGLSEELQRAADGIDAAASAAARADDARERGDEDGTLVDEESAQRDAASAALDALDDARRRLERLDREENARAAADEAQDRADALRGATERGGERGDGAARADAMERYLDRARGQQGSTQQGAGQQGAGQQGAAGDGSLVDNGAEASSGAGSAGQGSGGGRRLRELSRDPSAEGPGQGASTRAVGSGQGYSDGHIDDTLLDPTELGGQRSATRERSRDTGEGSTTSEIIAGAASGGFATTPYREVYQDYEAVTEEVMERESIPGGYRYYVRRYFELISPRDE